VAEIGGGDVGHFLKPIRAFDRSQIARFGGAMELRLSPQWPNERSP
jgi:hypothetical protein